ncbi:MAG: M23 family metallopeptidase [Candidatus Binatia bacterium]
MERRYSILILPWRGTRTRSLVLSHKSIRCLVWCGVILIGVTTWIMGDYLSMKIQEKRFEEARAEVQGQKEQLSALQKQAQDVQALLSHWRELQKNIKGSLPPVQRSSQNGEYVVADLATSLASFQSKIEQLIASIPTEWPIQGRVSSGYGKRLSPWTGKPEFHSGIDIPKPKGTPVYAPGDAVVKSVGASNGNGRNVILQHGQGITTHYLHLSKAQVKKGERVRKGQQIATVGNTGYSTNPHLHYEIHVNGFPVDPRRILIQQDQPSS